MVFKKILFLRAVHDVKATSLGVETSRFKAEIDFNGREITDNYLKQSCNLTKMLHVSIILKVINIGFEDYYCIFFEFFAKIFVSTIVD